MAMPAPRICCSSLSGARTRSRPLNRIRPAVMTPLRPRYRMSDMASVDLPQPDSPTRPTLSPALISIEKLEIAGTTLPLDLYSTVRPLIVSSGSVIEGELAQPIRQQIEAEDERDDCEARQQCHVRPDRNHRRRLLHHTAPIGIGWRQAEAKEAEDTDGNGSVAEPQAEIRDQRAATVGQQFHQQNVGRRLAAKLGRRDEVLAFQLEHEPAHDARNPGSGGEDDGDHDVEPR